MAETILLSAGGTGGHLFPAQALAGALIRRGWTIELATDHRATSYGGDFPARRTHIVPSGTPSSGNPLAVAGAVLRLAAGLLRSVMLMVSLKPRAVVGFGGYPTVPPLVAAWLTGRPAVLHEQNAVMGRANRLLARFCTRIALSVEKTAASPAAPGKAVLCGNPVRDAVRQAARLPYEPVGDGGPLRLVVFGGSQGARFFSDLMPEAVAALPEALRRRLEIAQQCRPEDLARVTAAYADLGLDVELAPFFTDLPQRIARAHLVVSRAGASTIGDLTVIGRPAVLVPLPGAIDQDQRANGAVLQAAGGAVMLEQATITPDTFATVLRDLIDDPAGLERMAGIARGLGRPDAVERLADLVEQVAGGR